MPPAHLLPLCPTPHAPMLATAGCLLHRRILWTPSHLPACKVRATQLAALTHQPPPAPPPAWPCPLPSQQRQAACGAATPPRPTCRPGAAVWHGPDLLPVQPARLAGHRQPHLPQDKRGDEGCGGAGARAWRRMPLPLLPPLLLLLLLLCKQGGRYASRAGAMQAGRALAGGVAGSRPQRSSSLASWLGLMQPAFCWHPAPPQVVRLPSVRSRIAAWRASQGLPPLRPLDPPPEVVREAGAGVAQALAGLRGGDVYRRGLAAGAVNDMLIEWGRLEPLPARQQVMEVSSGGASGGQAVGRPAGSGAPAVLRGGCPVPRALLPPARVTPCPPAAPPPGHAAGSCVVDAAGGPLRQRRGGGSPVPVLLPRPGGAAGGGGRHPCGGAAVVAPRLRPAQRGAPAGRPGARLTRHA